MQRVLLEMIGRAEPCCGKQRRGRCRGCFERRRPRVPSSGSRSHAQLDVNKMGPWAGPRCFSTSLSASWGSGILTECRESGAAEPTPGSLFLRRSIAGCRRWAVQLCRVEDGLLCAHVQGSSAVTSHFFLAYNLFIFKPV